MTILSSLLCGVGLLTLATASALAATPENTTNTFNAGLDGTVSFSIAAQPLDLALLQYSRQAGVQVISSAPALANKTAPAVQGARTRGEALTALLRGSNLSFVVTGDRSVAITPAPEKSGPATPAALRGPPPPPAASAAPVRAFVPPALEPIIVTARRREENLMTAPVTVSVMSVAAIDAAGVKTLRDLAKFTPGLFVQTQNTGGRADRSQVRLTFRGLSADAGVIFIDGAPYSGNGSPDVTSVARVEVLKGPQSVYFGRSTFSGAVNYVAIVYFANPPVTVI